MTAGTPHAILTRHFLRRFLESDLISPDADRSQLIALVGAACFCTTAFITVTVSGLRYISSYFTAGQAAVLSLDDKFFYIGLSMLVAALLAVAQWDALTIDARDASILEPLPLRTATIRRAKLSAVAILGGGAALILNLAPTLVFPVSLLAKYRVSFLDMVQLIAVHALVTMSAAAFGFAAVVALREILTALIGATLFSRISHLLQSALVIVLGSALLLLPGATANVEQRALSRSTAWSPPAWFLGGYEVLGGSVLIDAPRPSRQPPRLAERDRIATPRYRAHQAQFAALARVAAAALFGVLAAAALAYAWNARRLPRLAPAATAASHRHSAVARRLQRLLVSRHATVRAGFCFTLAVLWRSRTHRLTMACAAAVGLAVAVVALSRLNLQDVARGGRVAAGLLIVQPLLYGALLIGFRHAIRVPVELSSSWGFRLGWRGLTRQFLTGARRAAIAGLILPALVIVFPLMAYVLDPQTAAAHAALGFAGALLLLEALLLTYGKVPFTCSYLPDENLKATGPIYVAAFLLGAAAFARFQSAALTSPDTTVRAIVSLLAAVVALRLAARFRPAAAVIEFDELPDRTQELGLHA